MGGWIKLHRRIQDHWLWAEKPFDRRSAWFDLLLMASHTDRKIVVDCGIVEVGRGEIMTSEVRLSERWGWSRKKVRNFLALLVRDGMIEIIGRNSKGTALRIVNYSVYQDPVTAEEQHRNSSGTAVGTDFDQSLAEHGHEKGQHRNIQKANEVMAFEESGNRKRTVKEQQRNSSGTTEEQPEDRVWNTYKNKEVYKNVKKKKYDILSPADAGEERDQPQQEHMSPLAEAEKDQTKQAPRHTPQPRDETPYTEIVALWNEMARANNLPLVKTLTDQRKRAIKARWAEEGGGRHPDDALKAFKAVFGRVAESDFLAGRKDGSSWRADFDWVIREKNWNRIKEGVYDNFGKRRVNQRPVPSYISLEDVLGEDSLPP